MFWRLTAVGGLLGLDLGLLFAIWTMGGVGEEGGDVFLFYGLIGFVLGLGAGAIAGSWDSNAEPDTSAPWLIPAMLGVVGLNVGLLLAIGPAGGGVSADSLSIYLTFAAVGLLVGLALGLSGRAVAMIRHR